eukprot:625693-Prymnesium_polylepis.1
MRRGAHNCGARRGKDGNVTCGAWRAAGWDWEGAGRQAAARADLSAVSRERGAAAAHGGPLAVP